MLCSSIRQEASSGCLKLQTCCLVAVIVPLMLDWINQPLRTRSNAEMVEVVRVRVMIAVFMVKILSGLSSVIHVGCLGNSHERHPLLGIGLAPITPFGAGLAGLGRVCVRPF